MKKLSALTLFCTALFCAADYPAAVPGFNSASIYTSAGADGTVLQYRKTKTGEWLPALNMVLSPDGKENRGSSAQLRRRNTAGSVRRCGGSGSAAESADHAPDQSLRQYGKS